MQSRSKNDYLMIIDNSDNNPQSLSAQISPHHTESSNPENLRAHKPGTFGAQSAQMIGSEVDLKYHQTSRSRDDCKTQEHSSKHELSNSFAFTPKTIQPKGFTNSSDEEESENNYQSLTLKLQKALNKISLSSSSLDRSTKTFSDIWKRSQIQLERKRKEMERKRKENQMQRLKQFRAIPQIDKNSSKIAKDAGYQPIHIRAQRIVQQKKKRIEQGEQAKKRQQQIEESLYLQELSKHMKRPDTTRTYDQYYSEMMRWKQRAQGKNKLRFEEQKIKEIQSATFRPNLNQNSKKMVADQYRLPIDQRGLVKKKTKQEYTFTPKTTKRPYK